MKCEKIKELLLENIEISEMPDDFKKHLNECTDCREYYQELLNIRNDIFEEEDFYLSQEERERFIIELDQKIDQHELRKVTDISPRWKTYIPVVAAVVMILGVALVSRIPNLFNDSNQINKTENNDGFWIKIDKKEVEFVNTDNFENILIDYSSIENSINNEWMIDNVTEEEYQYLIDNFDIGEIL